MSSQKSTRAVVLPVRQRGRDRVASILDAAAKIFAAKGYDAATMTEIAANAGTAIGSLYRFFPSKELLADALFTRYADQILDALQTLAAAAPSLGACALADGLLNVMVMRRPDREAAAALADMRDDDAARRSALRAAIRERIAAILLAAGLPRSRATRLAPIVHGAMKILPILLRDGIDEAAATAELRIMIGRTIEAELALLRARSDQVDAT